MMNSESTVSFLLEALPVLHKFHSRESDVYEYLDGLVKPAIDELFGEKSNGTAFLHRIGELHLPYFSMGKIDSTHLFGLDELIIFSFYMVNSHRYRRVADLGANIGIHSVILSRLGYQVQAFEPDPYHVKQIRINSGLNSVSPQVITSAVSTDNGMAEFTRVIGNTTGSHLSGSKQDPYGRLETFEVETRCFREILSEHDLLKIDVEGHESSIICSTDPSDWVNRDAFVEVGSKTNAEMIFKHFQNSSINLFSQCSSWSKVKSLSQMPTSYTDGSLFISSKEEIPWQ